MRTVLRLQAVVAKLAQERQACDRQKLLEYPELVRQRDQLDQEIKMMKLTSVEREDHAYQEGYEEGVRVLSPGCTRMAHCPQCLLFVLIITNASGTTVICCCCCSWQHLWYARMAWYVCLLWSHELLLCLGC